MISRREYLMGRDLIEPLTPKLEENLFHLLNSLNTFRAIYGKPMIVTSGYRPEKINKAVGGRPNSLHMTCQACDFDDRTGQLAVFCLTNLNVLATCGLWIESPKYTKGWIHMQSMPPKSGRRVFVP